MIIRKREECKIKWKIDKTCSGTVHFFKTLMFFMFSNSFNVIIHYLFAHDD